MYIKIYGILICYMTSVYIVSTEEKAKEGIYKIGKHTGTTRNLESRYTTSLIDPIIYFFYPTIYASTIETQIKKQLDSKRIVNKNGNKSEWIHGELKQIIDIIFDVEISLQKNPIKLIQFCDNKVTYSIKDALIQYQKTCEKNPSNIPTIDLLVNNNISLLTFPAIRSLNMMTKTEFCNIFNSDRNPFVVYFEYAYCSVDIPKYHNLCYVNEKDILVFTENGWRLEKIEKIINFVLKAIYESILSYVLEAYTMMEKSEVQKIYDALYLIYSDDDTSIKKYEKILKNVADIQLSIINIMKKFQPMHFEVYTQTSILYSPDVLSERRDYFKKQNAERPKMSLVFSISD
jgi:hypothetical protein